MTAFLCFGDPSECQLCGGWMHSTGPDNIQDVPEGEPGICGRYCSTDCHDEAIEAGWHQHDCGAVR